MIATFLDLRKNPRKIIDALERREDVTILYRGKPKAVMSHVKETSPKTNKLARKLKAFGMWSDRKEMQDVNAYVRNIRKGRYDI